MGSLTDGIVHALIDCWPKPSPLITDHHTLRNLVRREIAQSKLLELPFLVQLVARLERLAEIGITIGGVKVENIDAIRPQLLQVPVKLLAEVCSIVTAMRRSRVELRSQFETPLLPSRFSCESLLFGTDVAVCCVDLVVSLVLEVVEDIFEFLQVGYTSTVVGITAKGHKTENDLNYQRNTSYILTLPDPVLRILL